MGVSIGISVYPGDGDDADALLRRADVALYRAKSAGRGTLKFAREILSEVSGERLTPSARIGARIETWAPALPPLRPRTPRRRYEESSSVATRASIATPVQPVHSDHRTPARLR